jgi:hypothetical protein
MHLYQMAVRLCSIFGLPPPYIRAQHRPVANSHISRVPIDAKAGAPLGGTPEPNQQRTIKAGARNSLWQL